MKKLLRLLAVLLFLFTASQSEVYAQKKSRAMTKADAAFNLEEYTTAIELYRKAYEKSQSLSPTKDSHLQRQSPT